MPTLDLGNGLNYSDAAFLDSASEQNIASGQNINNSGENPNSFEFDTDFTLSYNIYDGGFRGANIRSAKKELRTEELNLEIIIEQARFETSRDYYSLQNNDAQIALSQVRPTVSASASYGLNDDFEDDFDMSDQYSVSLNLEWRLFDGGAARAGARQSEKDIEIAETQFANQRNQIRFAVEQAYFGLESNQKNITRHPSSKCTDNYSKVESLVLQTFQKPILRSPLMYQ